MTDLTREDLESIRRGAQARQELERTQAAFAKLEANTIKALKATAFADRETADKLVCTLQILDAVRDNLMHEVAYGDAAQLQRERN